jgi:hypothetical protein
MKRIRIQRPKGRRERPWLEVHPLDPRDPDILRAKAPGRPGERRVTAEGSQTWAC